MKKILALVICIFLIPVSYAQEEKTADPGITPDSFLWGLDKALDNLNLLLTFDKGVKAKVKME